MRYGVHVAVVLVVCLAGAPATLGATGSREQGTTSLVGLDAEAQIWLTREDGGKAAVRQMKSDIGVRTRLLVHLPSGAVAPPAPPSLPENTAFQVAVVVAQASTPLRWSAEVNVVECPQRDDFRVKGTLEGIPQPDVDRAQKRGDRYAFALLAVGQAFECGMGQMKYTVAVSDGTSGTSTPVPATWRIRPVYHLTAGVGVGFDTGTVPSFAAPNGVVTKTDRMEGLSGAVGFIWYPGGVDFESMKPWQHFLNPFLLFDLEAPKDGFVVGTALTASGGLSVGLGLSVRKVAVTTTHPVDSAFTGEGTVPTEQDWTRDSLGAYFGLIIDTTLFRKLNPKGK